MVIYKMKECFICNIYIRYEWYENNLVVYVTYNINVEQVLSLRGSVRYV